MPTGLQTAHSGLALEAIKNGFQDCIKPAFLSPTSAVGTPPAGYFYSTISNRASIFDPAGDLKVSMGVERVQIRQGYEIINESGPQNERVWGVVDDPRIRLIGDWVFETNERDLHARSTGSASMPCYIEITFYGTGINLLTQMDISRAGLKYAVDNSSFSTDVWPTATLSAATRDRGYALNQPIKIASGLALGMHTVIIRSENTHEVWGVEILNPQTSNLIVVPGTAYIGALKTVYSGGTLSYSSGITGTKGGRHLVYLKSDKTVSSSFQPTDTTTRYIGTVDHSNEEMYRIYNVREFGTNRTDDFSSMTSTNSNRTFTLNDGCTTLQAYNSNISSFGNAPEGLVAGTGGFITFTFVGTGLDIVYYKANSTAAMDTFQVKINNTTIGTIPDTGNLYSVPTILKVASGLPYGTHQVQILRATATTNGCWITAFRTYQPKKPSLPDGAIELAEYCDLASFSGITTTGMNAISTGVIRKIPIKEAVYYGTGWSLTQTQDPAVASNAVAGIAVNTAIANDYLEYTFYGTGIEARFYQATVASYTDFTIDGYSNFGTMPNGNGGTGITTAFGGGTSAISVTTTNGSTNVTTAATTAIVVGATVTGTGIPAGAYVVSITNATTFVISSAATATGTVTATFTNLSWSASTGRLTGDSGATNFRGCYIRFSNLQLGMHTIRITRKTAHAFSIESLDVITPTYMPVYENTYSANGRLGIGSNNLADLRNFDFFNKREKRNLVSQSVDYASQTTTSTVFVPIIGTGSVVNTEKGGYFRVHWTSSWLCNSATGWSVFMLTVNGQPSFPQYKGPYNPGDALVQQNGTANTNLSATIDKIIYLGPGTHYIQIQWKMSSNTITGTCYMNTMNIVEER